MKLKFKNISLTLLYIIIAWLALLYCYNKTKGVKDKQILIEEIEKENKAQSFYNPSPITIDENLFKYNKNIIDTLSNDYIQVTKFDYLKSSFGTDYIGGNFVFNENINGEILDIHYLNNNKLNGIQSLLYRFREPIEPYNYSSFFTYVIYNTNRLLNIPIINGKREVRRFYSSLKTSYIKDDDIDWFFTYYSNITFAISKPYNDSLYVYIEKK